MRGLLGRRRGCEVRGTLIRWAGDGGSDAVLLMPIQLFRSIEETCSHLLWALERYQDRVWVVAHEESSMGRFLRDAARVDVTRAGCMLAATGKALAYVAQQRILLRDPLVRLYKDVETFQYRAVTDTYETIEKMEKSRTAYRAALLWMKDVSQKLDPDAYKQLDKFRKVQAHVRRSKTRFEKIKLDTHQKIDMLSASRVNLLSHSLTLYQSGLLSFFEKASRVLTATSDLFLGFQYFESNLLHDLKDAKRQRVDESLKQELEDKMNRILSPDSQGSEGPSSTLASLPPSSSEQEVPPLLDINPEPRAPGRQVTGQDFLTDFDSEKELLTELFATCQPPPPDLSRRPDLLAEGESESQEHLPSRLVDQLSQMHLQEASLSASTSDRQTASKASETPVDKWLNLFSELDPLSNPDAVGRSSEDDRNC